MKKLLSVCAAAAMLCTGASVMLADIPAAITAFAEESCGEGLSWSLGGDGTLTVRGKGSITSAPWQSTKEQKNAIQKIVIEKGVTSICNDAFQDCRNLASVQIPDSVTALGSSVFMNCKVLSSVSLPDSVTSIGSRAFYNCAALKSVELPANLKTLESYMFFE